MKVRPLSRLGLQVELIIDIHHVYSPSFPSSCPVSSPSMVSSSQSSSLVDVRLLPCPRLLTSRADPPLRESRLATMNIAVSPQQDYSLYSGAIHLSAGLACGLTGLSAGYAIGIVGDSVRLLSHTLFPLHSSLTQFHK